MGGTERDFRRAIRRLAAADADRVIAGQRKYGDSWKRRGGPGAFFGMARKWDRIERCVARAVPAYDIFAAIRANPAADGSLDGKDSLLDDIADLRAYLLLIEQHVRQQG